MTKFYNVEEMKDICENKGWTPFAHSKQGKWCYKHRKEIYAKLKNEYARSHRSDYTERELSQVIKHKYNGNWRNFSMNKEGKWCKDNMPEFFNKLRTKYQGQKFNFREMEYQKEFKQKISQFLKKYKLSYSIHEEVIIGISKGVKNRIDIILSILDYNLELPIELKHDESTWTSTELSDQKERYNSCLKNTGLEVYFVSPKGKYGFSEEEFFFILENLIKKEEILLANSLEWIREEQIVA